MLRFKLHRLFALSLLVTTLCARPAQAMGVTFDLADKKLVPQSTTADLSARSTVAQNFHRSEAASETGALPTITPLPIPPAASRPPIRITQSAGALPQNVIASARILTPPPQAAFPPPRVLHPDPPPSDRNLVIANREQATPIGLSFAPTQRVVALSPPQPLPTLQSDLPKWIYEGGSKSLVARVIGSAEGTRTASGQPTRAYYGHTDPGNHVWNIGTFSYQHGAHSPEEADRKQLQRLEQQGKQIARQASQAELNMSLGEILNGLDLANQSPRAALEQGGYVDRLVQAKQQGMKQGDAIVWARTYSYIEPKTQRWNAPGLGNTLPSIRRDQSRRHEAVLQAFDHYRAQRDTTADPVPETLAAPALTVVAQQPPASHPSPTQDTNVSEQIGLQQSQPNPLDFSVAEHFKAPEEALHHQQNKQLPPSPLPAEPELSVRIDDASASDSPPVQIIPEPEALPIRG